MNVLYPDLEGMKLGCKRPGRQLFLLVARHPVHCNLVVCSDSAAIFSPDLESKTGSDQHTHLKLRSTLFGRELVPVPVVTCQTSRRIMILGAVPTTTLRKIQGYQAASTTDCYASAARLRTRHQSLGEPRFAPLCVASGCRVCNVYSRLSRQWPYCTLIRIADAANHVMAAWRHSGLTC